MAELSKAIARLMEEKKQASEPRAEKRREAERGPSDFELFAARLLERAPRDFLDRYGVERVEALSRAAFDFFAAPGPRPRVRVYDPSYERDGWDAPVTVVETLLGDRPFVVDTVRLALDRYAPLLFLHPIVACERDSQGRLVRVVSEEAEAPRDSFLHVEIERLSSDEERKSLEAEIRERLADLVLVTDDYQAMRQTLSRIGEELRSPTATWPGPPPAPEVAAFLEWLDEGNFVFLGYRRYSTENGVVRAELESGLGLLRKPRSRFAQPTRLDSLPPPLRRRIETAAPFLVTKTNSESPVHRAARMDYVGVRSFAPSGACAGEHRILGLFTSRALAQEAAEVPVLRRKLALLLAEERLLPGSHDHKAFVALFQSIPKEIALALDADALRSQIRCIQAAERSDDLWLTAHPDGLQRGVFFLVILPRERFSAELARRTERKIVERLGGSVLDRHLVLDESPQARIHLYVAAPPEALEAVRPETLRLELRELLRTWEDELEEALVRTSEASRARSLARKYSSVFTPEYKATTPPELAARDVERFEKLERSREPQVALVEQEESSTTLLRLYLAGTRLVLSDFLPVLENLGLRVFDQDSIDLRAPDGTTIGLHAFDVLRRDGRKLGESAGPRLGEALLAHFRGRLLHDRLNTLVTEADLRWEQVTLLRAYAAHLSQTGAASFSTCVDVLTRYPECAKALWRYFEAKFDPSDPRSARERTTDVLPPLEDAFRKALDAVETARDDRVLRCLFATVEATVRTNFFARASEGVVAFKLDARNLAHLPRPRPYYEAFVYGPHVEGVHLRAARVARGGIRHTDRTDDYRTEILGLMKTQVAKNAVIVPSGAKGGFLVRRRDASAAEVVAAYRTFLDCLLDLVDNVVKGRVVPGPGVHYDGSDTYLVVAADKGTAAFSDIANEVARARGFWLGDAFASGGSRGYDHKKLGITARGAWECVRRHFREAGIDADREPIRVVGIGDMSGDVFGNGMLLSRHLRLVAAFDHRHVFLDPEGDPATAYDERARLFRLPRSSWADYDPAKLGPGGGVFPRTAKRVPLSPEVRAALGVEETSLSGEELVRAVLRADVDLLWNGGIGTYVKASSETHADAGDPANDSVRVDANQVRAKVVGEGGNLGFTQSARVEYALGGGRINTDAIDNAGGVTLSDHEVNIKIALAPAVESGRLDEPARDRLLAEITEDVVRRVLRQNVRQSLALGLEQSRSRKKLGDFLEWIHELEALGELDRAAERLPDRDTLRRRRADFLGLTRPELAVLLARTKLHFQHRILESTLPDDPALEGLLYGYFPERVVRTDRAAVRQHRLRREIVTVELANRLVDFCGTTFVLRVARDTGREELAVVRAWAAACALVDVHALWDHLLELSVPLPVATEEGTFLRIEAALERAVKWFLQTQDTSEPLGPLLERLAPSVDALFGTLARFLPRDPGREIEATAKELEALGCARDLAERTAKLPRLAEVLEIGQLASEEGVDLEIAARTYYATDAVVDFEWIREALGSLPGEDRWERRAAEGLLEGLMYARRALAREVLGEDAEGVEDKLRAFVEKHRRQADVVAKLSNDIRSAPRRTLAGFVVLMREIGRLLGR
ncbi:MAG: NAD-glutamate dehydrogenase [Candidatus Binatia bacterium]|nr:MAG: NAD-glutamate dehydrogenase [Candidatus Binatia bacterium]